MKKIETMILEQFADYLNKQERKVNTLLERIEILERQKERLNNLEYNFEGLEAAVIGELKKLEKRIAILEADINRGTGGSL